MAERSGREGSPTEEWKILMDSDVEHLYFLLLQLSSHISDCQNQIGGILFTTASKESSLMIKINDISDISDMLFKELDELFENITFKDGISYSNIAMEADIQSSRDAVLLLRCCMIILHLLEFKGFTYIMEKCQVLLKYLQELCYLNHTAQFSDECTCEQSTSYICFSEKYHSIISLRRCLLEAFIDQLSVHQHIRQLFRRADRFSGTNEKLFAPHSNYVDIGAILELVCTHFILSVNNEGDLSRVHRSLFCSNGSYCKVPQLSLTAIMALLRTTVACSAPRALQAHLISLASSCVGIHKNVTLLRDYISAFDQLVSYYRCLLTGSLLGIDLTEDGSHLGFCFTKSQTLEKPFHLSFDSYLQPATYRKINSQIFKLAKFHENCSDDLFHKTKEDKITIFTAYIKENHHIIEESQREITFLFLKSVLSAASSYEVGNHVPPKTDRNWQDICCAAAVMNLISSLLLQILPAFKDHRNSDGVKSLNDHVLWNEYELLSRIFCSFVQPFENHLGSNITCGQLEMSPASYDGIKLMLAHFMHLLLYSLDSGTDYIWKGCILVLMPLLSFLISKEGSLDSLGPLFISDEQSFTPLLSPCKLAQDLSHRRSSLVIASNLQKLQAFYLQKTPHHLHSEARGIHVGGISLNDAELEGQSEILAETELKTAVVNRCTSTDYLLHVGCSQSDIDDLADFVDCTRGRDYLTVLRNKAKFRKWKQKRAAASVFHERSKAWMKIIKYHRRRPQ